MDTHLYCAEKVLRPGSSLYYALRFGPAEHRDALVAIYAFQREVMEVADECHDPAVAKIKLQWWRDELQRLFNNQPQHPITRQLQATIANNKIPLEYYSEIVDGVEMWLDGGFFDSKDLTLFCHRVGAMTALMVAEVCGYRDRSTLKFAHEIGTALQLMQMLRDIKRHLAAGRMVIPTADLNMASITPNDLYQAQSSPAVRKLFRYQANRAQKHLDDALNHLPVVDRYAQRTLLIYAILKQRILAENQAQDFPLLESRESLTPLKKLWIAWRTERKERAINRIEQSKTAEISANA